MNLITMNCANNCKVIINLDEFKDNQKLNGACVFKRLFNLQNSEFKEENVNSDLFKIYNITKNDWFNFLNFLRNGRIKYDIVSHYIKSEKEREEFQKIFIQQLDEQCNRGIFLKFGPFPEFDKYVKLSLNRSLKNIKNIENIKKDNPMTP